MDQYYHLSLLLTIIIIVIGVWFLAIGMVVWFLVKPFIRLTT